MISDWPVYKDEWNSPEAELAIGSFQEVVPASVTQEPA